MAFTETVDTAVEAESGDLRRAAFSLDRGATIC